MDIQHRKRHRTSTRSRWLGLVFFAVAAACLYRTVSLQIRSPNPQVHSQGDSATQATAAIHVRPALEIRPQRQVYPYSVIPGGVSSLAEFAEALHQDPVVNAHYAGFDSRSLRLIRASKAMPMYASYRLSDGVYWTSHPVHIAAGELLITDGSSLSRARCGNRLSSLPHLPVSPAQPALSLLDSPNSSELVPPPPTVPGSLDGSIAIMPPYIPFSALVFEFFPPTPLSIVPAPLASGGYTGSAGFPGFPGFPGVPLSGSPPGVTLPLAGPAPTPPTFPSLPYAPEPLPVIPEYPTSPPIGTGAPSPVAGASPPPGQPVSPSIPLIPPDFPVTTSSGGGGGFPMPGQGSGGDTGSVPGQPITSIPLGGGPTPIEIGPATPGIPGESPDSPGPSLTVPEPTAEFLVCAGLAVLWMLSKRTALRSP